MLLKRTLLLAAGVLLFLVCFIGYFEWNDMQMENRFRQERQAHGVEGETLTTQIASSPATAPTSPSSFSATPAPAEETTSTPARAPASAPTATDTAAAPVSPGTTPAAPDTNVIIGPLPPSSAPDSAPAPSSPAPSDTNNSGGPMVPPSSTMLYPGVNNLALLMLAAYTPPPVGSAPAQTEPAAPPVATPTTNTLAAPSTNAPASTAPATHAAPSTITTPAVPAGTEPGTARPVPVEASVIVLLYHQFAAPGVRIPAKFQWTMNQDVFEAEMKYIHDNGYHVVPLSDVIRFIKHEIGLPPNSVAITIDDGYKSAIVYAEPILKKYGYPWTFFIYPDFVTTAESKGAASWNDLLALQAEGVDIECHSMTHPILTSHHQKIKGVWHNLTPAEYDQWLTNETAGAKTLLEQKMGKPITCFAYPYGAYNKEVEAKVIAAGFESIFTVADNPVRPTTKLTSIGRYTITQPVERSFAGYLRQGALGLADTDPEPGATISNPRPVITAVLGYAGTLDPKSIETEVRDFGAVRHDFDPKTSTVRLYLPRDLIDPVVLVYIRVRDAQTGRIMVANWRFNYEPSSTVPIHPPIGPTTSATNSAPAAATHALATSGAPAATPPGTPMAPPATHASAALPLSPSVSTTTAVPVTNQADPPQAATVAH